MNMEVSLQERSRKTVQHALVILVACSLALLQVQKKSRKRKYRGRVISKSQNLRADITFSYSNRMYSDHEFRRVYRMSHSTFKKLLFLVQPALVKSHEMGRRSGRTTVAPDIRLGVLLRLMTGSSVWDCMSAFAIGRSTTYEIFHSTRREVANVLDLPGLPETFDGLKTLAEDFQKSRAPANPLPGCVGALDGISIKIKKPPNSDHPATYYCRKGYYAIPVQALVDSNYRFLCFSAKCRGSTHDSLAHSVSSLGRYLELGNLASQFWIAGDEAYVCSESLITPVPASQADDIEDSFNFYLSSLRMHVEQAFGMLASKWRLLHSLEYSVKDSAEIVCLAMMLHNFCIVHGENAESTILRTRQDQKILEESKVWYEDGKHLLIEEIGLQDRTPSRKRKMLVDLIKKSGYRRPSVVVRQIPTSARGR